MINQLQVKPSNIRVVYFKETPVTGSQNFGSESNLPNSQTI